MARRSRIFRTVLLLGAWWIAACGEPSSSAPPGVVKGGAGSREVVEAGGALDGARGGRDALGGALVRKPEAPQETRAQARGRAPRPPARRNRRETHRASRVASKRAWKESSQGAPSLRGRSGLTPLAFTWRIWNAPASSSLLVARDRAGNRLECHSGLSDQSLARVLGNRSRGHESSGADGNRIRLQSFGRRPRGGLAHERW